MGYLDFEIRFEPSTEEAPVVAVVDAPAGQCRSPLRLQTSKLISLLPALGRQVRKSAEGQRNGLRHVSIAEAEVSPEQIGARLYRALFSGKLKTLLDKSRGMATAHDGLRICLRFDLQKTAIEELARLPWELLYEKAEKKYLFRGDRRTLLIRSLEVSEPVSALTVTPPFRILVVLASPRDLDPLDCEEEHRRISKALGGQDAIELVFLEEPRVEQLRESLVDKGCQGLHFMGHGKLDDSGEGSLAFLGEDGRADFVSATKLAQEIGDLRRRFMFFNACQTGLGESGKDPFAGVASALVREGLSAVVAMQFPISDHAAIRFAEVFYRRLASGDAIDIAVGEARRALREDDPLSLEWGTPVLYMRTQERQIVAAEMETPAQPIRQESQSAKRHRAFFGLIGALVLIGIAFIPVVYRWFVIPAANEAEKSCAQAESILHEVGGEVSSFPDAMCREPVQPDLPVQWKPIESRLAGVPALLSACATAHGERSQRLRGRLLAVSALRARDEQRMREYADYKRQAAALLPPEDPLITLFTLADRVDQLAQWTPKSKDPCLDPVQGTRWRAADQMADEVFARLTQKQATLPPNIRGCIWMLRAEQANSRAGFCGNPTVSRKAQALVSFSRAITLGGRPDLMGRAMAEVLRPGRSCPTGDRPPAHDPVTEASRWLQDDASRLGDDSIREFDVSRAVEALSTDRQTRLNRLAGVYKEIAPQKDVLYTDPYSLADTLIADRSFDEAETFLGKAAPVGTQHTPEFVWYVLKGKTLCFGGKYKESLQPLTAAAALGYNSLARRWGFADFLKRACATAAGELPAEELRAYAMKMQPDDIHQEICDVIELTPVLASSLRQHGAGRLLDDLGKKCPICRQ